MKKLFKENSLVKEIFEVLEKEFISKDLKFSLYDLQKFFPLNKIYLNKILYDLRKKGLIKKISSSENLTGRGKKINIYKGLKNSGKRKVKKA